MANEALAAGVKTIIAVGGDGTCSRVANAILRSGVVCRLVVIPCGTGNDFAKTLGVASHTPQQIAQLVAGGTSASIDVGLCEGYYFLNSCGFGFDASVLEATRRARFLTGDAVYVYSAVRQLLTYRGMSISVNGSAHTEADKMLMLTVSNGRFLGGAFRIAPDASAVDGKLDVGMFGDTGLIGRTRIFAGAFRGTHVGLRSVKTKQVAEITLRFSAPPMMEVDGELRQALSSTVKIECVPRALKVIAAPGYPV
jgi:YegS/Rv2252/BmrU family lipid kinase